MTEIIGTIATILAVTGVVCNNRRLRACFVIWLASNSMSCYLHVGAGLWSLAVRDGIFMVLAVEGWLIWTREKKST
ncbi:MAG TPA: nicotinamide mononucleotide transporter [Sedimentisphaerales bacterium]|nr:nicotinamide mononucleotide transporter [Sedimentisphaerales bacterium]